jgi:predicted ATPase/DNA-binding SARP family transcriptional activator
VISDVRLRLTLLGGFRAQLADGAALPLPVRKTQALLAYLALPLGRMHPRDELAALLWRDMPAAQARSNLRHALSRIRKTLPDPVQRGALFDGPEVGLDPGTVDVDVARFEALVADGGPEALQQIAMVYRGELLAGMTFGEPAFEEWLVRERERLHELAMEGLGGLLAQQEKADAAEAAVQTGLRLLALDPLQEAVHRAVMRLYARLGRRDAALRQYQACADVLRGELRAIPDAETRALHQEILRSRAGRPEGVGEPERAEPPPGNLPASGSALIGRESALADLAERLRAHRLVSLIGPGGIGKTRLALEAARREAAGEADGAWLVELAPLGDPALVPVAVAVALGLTVSAGAESPERVAGAIAGRHLLLVLDNCEHVIDAAARMAEALLRANPHARVLVTSREPLRAPGESVYRVGPLEVPSGERDAHGETPGAVLETAAVRLFVARARALDPRFALDRSHAAVAGAVCRRLDGIPLAIELAAARAAALGVETLAAHLDERLELPGSAALPRHQTLRATLDWSYGLLPPGERSVLERVAMFPGSFTLEAAGAVASSEGLGGPEVMDAVGALVAKSLVSADPDGAVTRYRLLETTRAYALEKLAGRGEREEIARRHAEYCREVLERAEGERESRPTGEWLGLYGRYLDDVRAALDWTFSPRGDAGLGVSLTAATVPLWMRRSLMTECCARVEHAIARLPGVPPDPRRDMRLFLALGSALLHTPRIGSPAMIDALARALELAERLDDAEYRLRILHEQYAFRLVTGAYREALAIARRFVDAAPGTADPVDTLIGHRLIGLMLHVLGDQAGARRHVEPLARADLASARRAHIVRYQFDQRVVTQSIRARIAWLEGYPAQALREAAHAVETARAGDHRASLFYALMLTACPIALHVGDLAAADRYVAQFHELAATQSLAAWATWARCFEAVALLRRGEAASGVARLRAALGELPPAAFHIHHVSLLGELSTGLGELGEVAEGLALIDEALARARRTEEGWIVPELLRRKGDLLLQGRGPEAAPRAEGCFAAALEWATRQHTLPWALRSATSLARFWVDRGRTAEARQVLEAVRRRFSEGFETADLQAAGALLGALGAPP